MKHLILFSICFFLFATVPLVSKAQSSSSANPPHRVQANFNAKFPDHKGSVKWQETNDGYQATIRQSNKEVVSNFNKDGRWVQNRTALKENEIPKSIREYINDSYKAYEYQQGYRYDTKKGSRYELDIWSQDKNSRLEFDKDGVFIKES